MQFTTFLTAKKLGLCYCCLGKGHLSETCHWSRECGIDGCQEHHHRIVHQEHGFFCYLLFPIARILYTLLKALPMTWRGSPTHLLLKISPVRMTL